MHTVNLESFLLWDWNLHIFKVFFKYFIKTVSKFFKFLAIAKTLQLVSGFFCKYLLNLYKIRVTRLICIYLFLKWEI